MEQRISIITSGVRDLSKTIDFYGNVLEWKK